MKAFSAKSDRTLKRTVVLYPRSGETVIFAQANHQGVQLRQPAHLSLKGSSDRLLEFVSKFRLLQVLELSYERNAIQAEHLRGLNRLQVLLPEKLVTPAIRKFAPRLL